MTQVLMREYEQEPVPGLPGTPPQGETILWQGAPDMNLVARRVLKRNWLMAYLALLAGWALVTGFYDQSSVVATSSYLVMITTFTFAILALIYLFAWGVQKTTLYTITNRRIMMRIGVALSVTLNLPFSRIAGANVKREKDHSGVIAFETEEDTRLSWLMQWPHVRAWHFARTQPAMICLTEVGAPADILTRELQRVHEELSASPGHAGLTSPDAMPAE